MLLNDWCTHMPKLLLSQRFIVPVHCGSGWHFLPTFAGDAAQSESFSHNSFRLGVHLRAATVALRYCIGESNLENQTINERNVIQFPKGLEKTVLYEFRGKFTVILMASKTSLELTSSSCWFSKQVERRYISKKKKEKENVYSMPQNTNRSMQIKWKGWSKSMKPYRTLWLTYLKREYHEQTGICLIKKDRNQPSCAPLISIRCSSRCNRILWSTVSRQHWKQYTVLGKKIICNCWFCTVLTSKTWQTFNLVLPLQSSHWAAITFSRIVLSNNHNYPKTVTGCQSEPLSHSPLGYLSMCLISHACAVARQGIIAAHW